MVLTGSNRRHSPASRTTKDEVTKTTANRPLAGHVSAIVNGRAPVTPDMAVRLAGVFGTEPQIWINLQARYELWFVLQRARRTVKSLHATA